MLLTIRLLIFGADSSSPLILAVCFRSIARVLSLDISIKTCNNIVNVSYFPQLRGKKYEMNCSSAASLSIPSTSRSGRRFEGSTIDSSLSSMSAVVGEVLIHSTEGGDAIGTFYWNYFSVGL